MKFPAALLTLSLAAAAPHAARAQLPSIQKAITGSDGTKAAAEKPDDAKKRLESWQQEAQP